MIVNKIEMISIKMKFLIFFVLCIHCVSSERPDINILKLEKIKDDFFTAIDNNVSSVINETSLFNSSEYRSCLNELNVIKNGLTNFEDWAITMIDSWGRMPSGILFGNLVDFGSFSQCFRIVKDEEAYKTQYCLGSLTFQSKELIEMMDKNIFIRMPNNFPSFHVPEPGFTFGICMPATCSVEHFEHILNHFSDTKSKGVTIKIPKNTCQVEEYASDWRPLDVAVIYFLALISVLVVASTSYDIFCTFNKRNKLEIFLVFSFYTNGKKLFTPRKSESTDAIDCLYGIRAISAQWVVFGHVCLPYTIYPEQLKRITLTLVEDYGGMLLISAPIAVDTFLVLSGLLVSLNILKHLERNGKIKFLMMYLHRYLRLTPLLCVIVLSMSLLRFMGSGPLWPQTVNFLSEPCERYWWSSLLYIQNYVNPSEMCLMHTWYLSVDMHLYIIAPFIIYLIYRYKTKTIFALVILICGCIWITLAIHVKYGLKSVREDGKMELAYFPTHIRYSSWLIGVIGGYVLYESQKRSVRIPKIFNLFAWATSFALMAYAVFANHPLQQLDTKSLPIDFGIYDAMSRVCWAISLCYIIFACVHNSGGYVNWFLSHPYWQPISRLCYSTYVLHFPVIFAMTGTIKAPLIFSQFNAIEDFVRFYLVTIVASIIATLAFESPILIIEKLIWRNATDKKSRSETNGHSKQKLK